MIRRVIAWWRRTQYRLTLLRIRRHSEALGCSLDLFTDEEIEQGLVAWSRACSSFGVTAAEFERAFRRAGQGIEVID